MSPILTISVAIGTVLASGAVQLLVSKIYLYWKRKDAVPDELRGEVQLLRTDVNALRGSVKYIEGRLNGRHWKSEA